MSQLPSSQPSPKFEQLNLPSSGFSAPMGAAPANTGPMGTGPTVPPGVSPEQYTRDLEMFAAEQIRLGTPPQEIERKLLEHGIDPPFARAVVSKVWNVHQQVEQSVSDAHRKSAQKKMLVGGLVCLVGVVITVGSYVAAANNGGGGRYMITWGAIVFGAIQFVTGFVQWCKR